MEEQKLPARFERGTDGPKVIVAGLDGRYTYEELMYDMCILPESDIRYGLPFEWNSLEHYDLETHLIQQQKGTTNE